jgi:mono/diheme cytochrome c family protein
MSRGPKAVFQGSLLAAITATAVAAAGLGDERALTFHVDQDQAGAGIIDVPTLIEAGRLLFTMRFTSLDGAGRPAATGAAAPTRRVPGQTQAFSRTTGPDSGSCAACHNQPDAGGGGDFVVNVFVGPQERPADVFTIAPEFTNERGTTGMHGSGLIELLAREMTNDLLAIRAEAISQAASTMAPVRRELITKGVDFGVISAQVNGDVDTSEVEGVGADLVIRPWSQKGLVISLREFTINAMNHHHGMQAVERYGMGQTGTRDFDQDKVALELTAGDLTAVVLYQAALAPPRQIIPNDPDRAEAVLRGGEVFEEIGCASCHRQAMVLNDLVFTEPAAIAGKGTLSASDVQTPVKLDLADLEWAAELERTPEGGYIVRPFTDLKRHVIADDGMPFFDNETLRQGFWLQPLPGPTAASSRQRGFFGQERVPTNAFLTRRLWGAGNSGPYGHRGDLSTLNEAILMHGGEAREQKIAYQTADHYDRAALIEFLLSWRIVPAPAAPATTDLKDSPLTQYLRNLWQAGAADR